jgi:TolB protein
MKNIFHIKRTDKIKLSIAVTFLYLFASLLIPARAEAKVYIDIDAPSGQRLPIAIQEFSIQDTKETNINTAVFARSEVIETLKGDLVFSGLFSIIAKEAHIENPEESGISRIETDFSSWRVIGADALIKGKIKVVGESLSVEMRLFDTVKETTITGTRYIGKIINPRVIAHRFADEIIKELTGEPGIFATRFLFVAERTGNKEVYMCDYDGKNIKQLTHNNSINLSPRWSPNGRRVMFTSYKLGSPVLYERTISSGRERAISKSKGINIGGRWSPDGNKVALTLSIDRNPELYVLNMESKKKKRITRNHGIDVSPSWSPDGNELVYVSDIAGNPHIYVLTSRGGIPKRLTYKGKYNATPVWSPDGKRIVFSRMRDGKFNIWTMLKNGKDQRQLTFTGNNESPSWSPDSRYIVFSSSKGEEAPELYIMRFDGTGLRKIPIGLDNLRSPSWSPFLTY